VLRLSKEAAPVLSALPPVIYNRMVVGSLSEEEVDRRRARFVLDQLEADWRGSVGRMAGLLAERHGG
jgi:hypothetical protein